MKMELSLYCSSLIFFKWRSCVSGRCVCVGGGGRGKCTYPAHCRALWLVYRTFDLKVTDSQPGLYRCVVSFDKRS